MLVTVALLAVYGAYAAWTAYVDRSWLHALVTLVALVACVGTALLQPWSRYLVYLLTTGFLAAWSHSVYEGYVAGYFRVFFVSPLDILRSLAPGLALVVLSAACSYAVFRHYRRAARPASVDGAATET